MIEGQEIQPVSELAIKELVDPGLDKEVIETLGASLASIEEVASYMKVAPAIIEEFYTEPYLKGTRMARFNLKTWQMEKAQKGDVSMLKWMGTQHLGQKTTR